MILIKIAPLVVTTFFLYSVVAFNNATKMLRIAVIDTGFDFDSSWPQAQQKGLNEPILCESGHRDFTFTGLQDRHGHGTHVVGLIAKYAHGANYCIVIIKAMDNNSLVSSSKTSTMAIEYASKIGVSVINYSGGGKDSVNAERLAVKRALQRGVVLIAAAGNEGNDLNLKPFYPASYFKLYKEIRVVVASDLEKSNFSKGAVSEQGREILSFGLSNQYVRLSGTSQATAIHAGKFLKKVANNAQ